MCRCRHLSVFRCWFVGVAIKKINDGGQAFPMPGHECELRGFIPCEYGMTLRDWFAGMALQGSLASNHEGYEFSSIDAGAKWAYEQADAMLKARSS